MMYFGIDLGTSACKLLLVDGTGQVQNTVTKEYPLSFPRPGWSEQDPAHWRQAVLEGVPELLTGFDAAQVKGIGCGGQMHGLVALDRTDAVLRPAILWNDGRTAKEVDYLNGIIGREKLSQYTANIAFAGFTAPKLLWMRENEPELFGQIEKIMLPKDYLVYCLTGVHVTDYSDASGMLLLDVARKRWSAEMCGICGITEKQLPKLHESWEPVGTLLPDIARALGLPETVIVCAGAGDNAAAAVGTGTVGNGGCNISLGTSGTIFISSDCFGVDPSNALHSFAHADGGYHLMGCMLSAASCNLWLMEDIFKTQDYAGEQAAITQDKLGRNHVFFLPYLMGERSPINDTDARGCFICGGGSKSGLWRTIMANVLGIPLDIPATEQGPGYGGAMLAMVAAGQFPTVQAAADALVQTADTVEPDPALTALYDARYQQFRKIYPACKTLFPQLL